MMKKKIKKIAVKLKNTGFTHLFGSSVINKIVSFMSNVILIRLIPKAGYGVFSNADNILGLFCLLEGFGVVSSFLQFGCTSEGEEKENVWSFSFYFSLIFQIFLSISIMVSALIFDFKIKGTGRLLLMMSLLPIVRLIRDMQQIYLRTELRNKEYAFANTFSTVITLLTAVLFSVFFLEVGLIIANYISAIASILLMYYKFDVKFPNFKNKLLQEKKKKIIKFSAISVINNSTSSIMYLLDTFVLGIVVASSTVTASYKVATKIPTALMFIPTCVITYIYPYFAKRKDDAHWCLKNFKNVTMILLVFNGIFIGLLIYFAPVIINLFFGNQYQDVLVIFRLLCLNYIIQASFGRISGQLLVSQEKIKFNTFMGFFSSILNTILNLCLIPLYSSTGAALATLIVTAVASFSKWGYLYGVLKRKIKLR